jgi:secreted Zn-dependent insulinase-like peptidase
MLESDRHHRLDKIAAVAAVTPAELRAHLPELLRSLFVDILAHGNMTAAQATEFARTLQVCLCVCATVRSTSGQYFHDHM